MLPEGKFFLDSIFQVLPLGAPARLKAKGKVGVSSLNALQQYTVFSLCFQI